VPEFELLQHAAQNADLDVDGPVPGTFRLAPCDIASKCVAVAKITFVTCVSARAGFILA
jgi:hypothetical protein